MLNRKQSGASRASSAGRFTVHRVDSEIKDYQFERDSVRKIAKVTRVDGSLTEEGEKMRSVRLTVGSSRSPSGERRQRSSSAKKQFESTQSRFRDTVGTSFSNCHRYHFHDEKIEKRENEQYAPLRSNADGAVYKAIQ